MALAYLDTSDRLNKDPDGVQVAGLLREAPLAGLKLLQRLWRESQDAPDVEWFTFPDASRPYPGLEAEAGPYLIPGDRDTLDPRWEALATNPDRPVSTAHTHPGQTPGSFSPTDLHTYTAVSSPIKGTEKRPTDWHWLLQPGIERYEGLRLRDDSPEARSMLYDDVVWDIPASRNTGNVYLTPIVEYLDDAMYDLEDLLDPKILQQYNLDPNIADDFEAYYAPDYGVPFNKWQIPLMDLAEKDVIDYTVLPETNLDRYFDAYKTIMRDR